MRLFPFAALLLAASTLAAPTLAAPQRCAHVTAGVVDNVIVADPSGGLPAGVDCSNTSVQIGWAFSGSSYTPGSVAAVYQVQGLTFFQFTQLFTPAEYTAIITAEQSDANIGTFITKYAGVGSSGLNLSDVNVVTAINYLVSKSLINSARATAILSGSPHP